MKRTPGIVQIYTGEGKGKTTAACGLALRALSHGRTICYVQFFKQPVGEVGLLKRLPDVRVLSFCRRHPAFSSNPRSAARKVREELARAWPSVHELVADGTCDLVILDEIIIAVRDKLLPETALLALVRAKARGTELVLTGRGAGPRLRRAADLVTEMRAVKHPYPRLKAREGIEY